MEKEFRTAEGIFATHQRQRGSATKVRREARFAVCIDNDGYQASLELGKLYRLVPDKEAQSHGLVRIIDESGEDYAYSSNRFHSMKVPSVIERALQRSRP